jgi:hypothetical protein
MAEAQIPMERNFLSFRHGYCVIDKNGEHNI